MKHSILYFIVNLTHSCIKNPHVRCSLACGALKGSRKWCLTGNIAQGLNSELGTPIHNTLKDLYGLFRFLEVPALSDFSEFSHQILSRRPREGALRVQIVLRSLMLRRKKDEEVNGRPLIVLPTKVNVNIEPKAHRRK